MNNDLLSIRQSSYQRTFEKVYPLLERQYNGNLNECESYELKQLCIKLEINNVIQCLIALDYF